MWVSQTNDGLAGWTPVAIGVAILYSSLVLAVPTGLSAKAGFSKRDPDCRMFNKVNLCNIHLT